MPDHSSFLARCAAIKKIPVFSSLGWLRVQALARSGEMVRFRKGETVSRQGTPPDFVYFLVSGRLLSYSLDAGGHKDDVEFIHRGMFFGIISALTGEAHSQTFEAINDSVVFRLPAPRFRGILKRIPELGLKFSKSLSQRIRARVTRSGAAARSIIVSVYAPVAGSGGSTFALGLAMSLRQETGDRTVFISISSRTPSAPAFVSDVDEIRPKWKTEPRDLAALIEDMDAVPGQILRSDVGVDMLNVVVTPGDERLVRDISDFVSSFIDSYRYIVVDLPSELDELVLRTLTQSDIVYLVGVRDKDALADLRTTLNRIEERFQEEFNEDRVRVVVGGVLGRRGMGEEAVRLALDYNVAAFLPHVQRKDLGAALETPHLHYYTVNPESQYGRLVTRIARKVSGVSIGLVLGGGAAFGLAHIGVLRVLEEEGIPVDVVAGSSMGALIGCLWAAGYRSDELQQMAREFRRKANLVKLVDLVFPVSGLISGKAVMAWLRSKLSDRTFRDLRLPLRVVAYDLVHRQDLVIQDGPLVDAIRKSISIPGVFQPIVGKDTVIIDGGVMNPLPVNVLATSEVKKTIAVNVLQSPEDVIRSYELARATLEKELAEPFLKDPWYFLDVRFRFWVNRTFFPNISDIIVRTLEASEYVIASQSARGADVVIHPDLSGLNWYELYNVDVLIQRGEEAARRQIERIRSLTASRK